jgi:hypothetical protein
MSIKMSSWRNSASLLANMSMPNKFFWQMGLFDRNAVKNAISVSTY